MIDKMRKELLIITIVFMLISCIKKTTINSVIYEGHINREIESVIKEYMKHNKDIKTYLLLTDYCMDDNISYSRKRMIIGPAHKGIFCNGEGSYCTYPSSHICIDENYIFIHSSIDMLADYNKTKSFYKEKSILLEPKISYGSCMIAFLSKAMLLEVDIYKEDVKIISQRPDTLLIKKRVEFTPLIP